MSQPNSKEAFLLRLLAGIFIVQASFFGVGMHYCINNGGLKSCPKIKESYEQTFNVMLATTLALLSSSAINKSS
jgi:hypothetical protein